MRKKKRGRPKGCTKNKQESMNYSELGRAYQKVLDENSIMKDALIKMIIHISKIGE